MVAIYIHETSHSIKKNNALRWMEEDETSTAKSRGMSSACTID